MVGFPLVVSAFPHTPTVQCDPAWSCKSCTPKIRGERMMWEGEKDAHVSNGYQTADGNEDSDKSE